MWEMLMQNVKQVTANLKDQSLLTVSKCYTVAPVYPMQASMDLNKP